jgi:DNA polymerase-3 subunit delta
MAADPKGITHETIVRDVRAGKIAPVYYLMGEEPYYIDRVSEFLVQTLIKPEDRDFNLDVVYGADVTINRVIELAQAYPMMADRRVVLVREAQMMRSLEGLEQYVQHHTPSTVLILCHKHGTLDKRKPAYKAIQQIGVLYESRRMQDYQLPSFISSYIKRGKAEIESSAAQMLAEHVGNDLCRLSAEMDKLLIALPQGQNVLTATMVEELTGVSKDYNNFELVAALAQRDTLKAFRIVKYYQGDPRSFALPSTLSVIFTFFSDLMLAYYSPDKSEGGVAEWLGKPGWKVRKEILPALKNYTGMKVLYILGEIRKTDALSKGVGGGRATHGELLQELISFILL